MVIICFHFIYCPSFNYFFISRQINFDIMNYGLKITKQNVHKNEGTSFSLKKKIRTFFYLQVTLSRNFFKVNILISNKLINILKFSII